MLLWGLVRAGGKMLVAPATASALSNHHALVRMREVMQALARFIVINNGPDRDFQDDAFAIAPGAVGSFTMASALAFIFRIKAEMDQRVMALAGLHNDVAAAPTVAAVWAAAQTAPAASSAMQSPQPAAPAAAAASRCRVEGHVRSGNLPLPGASVIVQMGDAVLAVSSRGELAISIGRRYVMGFHQCGRLAMAPLEGGEPRVVAEEIQGADFTPDGR